ncbi:hypothetical protein HCJ76_44005 [Streptomyces sp. MC1]|uniref:hypothetical protein n=1 Tax=Streptomyces sp. MC1 TaxID=295105 RepID=UPI0018CB43AC|nr:hypothetical protein [Streptomyces sp. MC1]MBG7704848.1 hypothetical protein [Streptomyces sp. MC1]
MSQFLARATRALRPLHLAMLMTVSSFFWNVVCMLVGFQHDSVTYYAQVALIVGGTCAVTGNGLRAVMAFALAGAFANESLVAGIIPALAVMNWRIVRRLQMLDQRDKTARRDPGMGFWRTLQAWVGWSATP